MPAITNVRETLAEATSKRRAKVDLFGRLDPAQVRVMRGLSERIYSDELVTAEPAERRMSPRHAFPHPIQLIPCNAERKPLFNERLTVMGKDISSLGIGFIHTRALREKWVIVGLQNSDGIVIFVLTEIRRVEAVGQGLYAVGGSFVERVDLPCPAQIFEPVREGPKWTQRNVT